MKYINGFKSMSSKQVDWQRQITGNGIHQRVMCSMDLNKRELTCRVDNALEGLPVPTRRQMLDVARFYFNICPSSYGMPDICEREDDRGFFAEFAHVDDGEGAIDRNPEPKEKELQELKRTVLDVEAESEQRLDQLKKIHGLTCEFFPRR